MLRAALKSPIRISALTDDLGSDVLSGGREGDAILPDGLGGDIIDVNSIPRSMETYGIEGS